MVRGTWARTSDEQLSRHLDESYGLRNLKPGWVSRHGSSQPSFLIRSICNSEIREITNGSLPWRVQDAHAVRLGTKVLAQVDKVMNVGAPDSKAPTPRLLQFALTDGSTSFIGIELDATKSSFSPDTVPGTKLILLHTALIRRGRLFLTYEDYTLLGAPQGRFPTSRNDEAMHGSASQSGNRQAGGRQSAGSNTGEASRSVGLNGFASSIIDVGGIAAILQETDNGAENDGLWNSNPTVRSQHPPPMTQQVPRSALHDISATRGTNNTAQRSTMERGQPSGMISTATKLNRTREVTIEQDNAGCEYESNGVAEITGAADRQHSTGRPTNPVPMDVDNDLIVVEATQRLSGSPSAPERLEDLNSDRLKPTRELERMDIIDSRPSQIARLKDLIDSRCSSSSRPQLCRLFARKIGKKLDHQLTSGVAFSTLVDDGTAVKVIAVSAELVDNLRQSCYPRERTFSQGVDQSVRRSLRAIQGFVQMEVRGNKYMATASFSDPVSSMMLSEYLDDVSAKFARYLAS